MTTPARRIWESIPNLCHIDTGSGTWNLTQHGGFRADWRNASGSSPLRSDGTRAPRAWQRFWGYINVIPASAEWKIWDAGGWNITYRSSDIQSWSQTPVAFLRQVGSSWVLEDTGYGYFPVTPQAAARTKLLNKLQDGKANLGQTLGEARQTVQGLSDLAETLLDFVSQMARYYRMEKRAVVKILRGQRISARDVPNYKGDLGKAIKGIPSAWLGLQFGVKPLLSDIDDSAKALQWLLDGSPREPTMTIRAGHSDVETAVGVYRNGTSPSWECHVRLRTQSDVHLSCTYEIATSRERTYSQLGVSNTFAVMYELCPWSWAFDYVTDTGDWINSLFARDGTRFIEGSETHVMVVTSGDVQIHPGDVLLVKPPVDRTDVVLGRMERYVLTSSPGPWMPTFRNRIGLNQMANLMAALSQLR